MRIIAGKYKYKKLNEFNVPSTRPTADKVKEAEFDMIRYFRYIVRVFEFYHKLTNHRHI